MSVYICYLLSQRWHDFICMSIQPSIIYNETRTTIQHPKLQKTTSKELIARFKRVVVDKARDTLTPLTQI